MYYLSMMTGKLKCIVFMFLMNAALHHVSATPKDDLSGYIKNPQMVGIPYLLLTSIDMTATICCDICYLNRTTYAVILDQNCTCTSNLLNNTFYQCDAGKPCPGNSTESCGCNANNYAVVYNVGTSYTYTVGMMTSLDKLATSFKADIYVNIIGPDGRECREVATVNSLLAPGGKTSIIVQCRDLKGFSMLRLGHSNKKTGWSVEKVTVDDPVVGTTYSFPKCGAIYLGNETGNGTMAEFRVNSACRFPVKGDNYFSLEERPTTTVIVCSSGFSNVDCKGDDVAANEYVAFARYFHKHVFPLTGLVYIEKDDCDNISIANPKVAITARQGSVVGSYYTLNCTNGFFTNANNIRTTTIRPVCQANGQWSVDPLPECRPACLGKMAGVLVSNQSAVAGDVIAFTCQNGVFDGFSDPCNKLEVTCLTGGNWSYTSIPSCIPSSSASLTTNVDNKEVICPNSEWKC